MIDSVSRLQFTRRLQKTTKVKRYFSKKKKKTNAELYWFCVVVTFDDDERLFASDVRVFSISRCGVCNRWKSRSDADRTPIRLSRSHKRPRDDVSDHHHLKKRKNALSEVFLRLLPMKCPSLVFVYFSSSFSLMITFIRHFNNAGYVSLWLQSACQDYVPGFFNAKVTPPSPVLN